MTIKTSFLSLITFILILGCGNMYREGEDSTSAVTIGDQGEDTSESTSAEESSNTEGSFETSLGDENTFTDLPGDQGEGCEFVSILLGIDNSGSMGEYQQSLIASFPGFTGVVQSLLPNVQGVQVAVNDSDPEWVYACNESLCNFPQPLPECLINGDNACDGGPSACDTTPGGFITFPAGKDATNKPCKFAGGQRYASSQNEPSEQAFAEAVACPMLVGTGGNGGEQSMGMVLAGLDQTESDQCNVGFRPEDAILLVVVISDSADYSTGTPEEWGIRLLAGRHPQDLIFLGILGDETCGDGDYEKAVRTEQMMEMLANGTLPDEAYPPGVEGEDRKARVVYASICSGDYATAFAQAANEIESACDNFEPVE